MPTLCCSWNCQGESLGREEETRQVSVSRLEETLIVQGFSFREWNFAFANSFLSRKTSSLYLDFTLVFHVQSDIYLYKLKSVIIFDFEF